MKCEPTYVRKSNLCIEDEALIQAAMTILDVSFSLYNHHVSYCILKLQDFEFYLQAKKGQYLAQEINDYHVDFDDFEHFVDQQREYHKFINFELSAMMNKLIAFLNSHKNDENKQDIWWER